LLLPMKTLRRPTSSGFVIFGKIDGDMEVLINPAHAELSAKQWTKRNKDDRSSVVVLAFRFGMILVLAASTLAACRSGRYPQLCYAESGKGDAAITSTVLGLL
jgi:hypothetical protein